MLKYYDMTRKKSNFCPPFLWCMLNVITKKIVSVFERKKNGESKTFTIVLLMAVWFYLLHHLFYVPKRRKDFCLLSQKTYVSFSFAFIFSFSWCFFVVVVHSEKNLMGMGRQQQLYIHLIRYSYLLFSLLLTRFNKTLVTMKP